MQTTRTYTHPNQEPVALQTALPLVQFVVEHGHGQKFCFQDFRGTPTRGHGIKYLHEVANKLPSDLRSMAVSLIERNTAA